LRPPRTLRPTRAGWSFFAITFGVGCAALNTGNNLLYLALSLMLAFLVLSGALSESALRGISVRRRLSGELFARTPCSVGLVISNHQKRVAAFAIVVEDRLRGPAGTRSAAGRSFALRVGPGETESRVYRLVPERRGELCFAGFEVYTRFPFGLFSKSLTLEAEESVLVYPEVERIEALLHLGPATQLGEGRTGSRGSGPTVSGLRAFEKGDPSRRVHWPRSLRRGALFTREQDSEERIEVEVQLLSEGRPAGDGFERSVRWAASEVVAYLEAGSRVALVTDSDRIPADSGPRQRARLLSYLARVAAQPARAA